MKDLYLIQPKGWTQAWLLASKDTQKDSFTCLGPKIFSYSHEVIAECAHRGVEYNVTEIELSVWLTSELKI